MKSLPAVVKAADDSKVAGNVYSMIFPGSGIVRPSASKEAMAATRSQVTS